MYPLRPLQPLAHHLHFSAGDKRRASGVGGQTLDFFVKLYDFEVLKGDRVVSARRAVGIQDLKDAWPLIAEMAVGVNETGCRIRVTEAGGAIVILTGVAAARLHSPRAIAA